MGRKITPNENEKMIMGWIARKLSSKITGLSHYKYAIRKGLPDSTYSRMRRGKFIDCHTFIKILNSHQINFFDFFTGENNPFVKKGELAVMREIGGRLRVVRKGRGVTGVEMGKTGIPENTVYRIEQGRPFSVLSMLRLCSLNHITIDEL